MRRSNLIRWSCTVLLLMMMSLSQGYTQEDILTKSYKDKVIQTVAQYLTDYYVFPELAQQTAEHLTQLNKENYFEQYTDLPQFAEALSSRIYAISKDKHISVNVRKQDPAAEAEIDEMEQWIASRMEERRYFRRYNANFKSVSKLDGNIGYLDLRGFYGLDFGLRFADYAMAMLATSDAIIIDLRNNSGGRGDMVGYLLSYFFDEPVIGSKTRKRSGDQFTERINMTSAFVNGKKMPDVPLFVLTSKTTFSAAEGFSYPLKVYKRATFIGETTKGGANPGDIIPLNDELEIFIPDVSVTHPVTNASWEGVGISPDVSMPSEQALDSAKVRATEAAAAYRQKLDEKAKASLLALSETVENYDGSDAQIVIDAYLACRENDLIFEEWEVNALGYQLLAEKAEATALAIFKTNTVLYPFSPNTFDSYAEALMGKGRNEEAIENYQQAVRLAEERNDPDLALFKENLENALKPKDHQE
ncbi:MAG: S41 family peptidase [Bacteroidota bacterium]